VSTGAPEKKPIAPRTYVLVCLILVLLTVLTVSISFIHLSGVGHMVIGLTKGTLVVLFFMHALLSDRVTWIVIVVASFWLGLLVVLTFCDYLTREMLPYMPGH
jgi:cytochrome c oxidase subunit 4